MEKSQARKMKRELKAFERNVKQAHQHLPHPPGFPKLFRSPIDLPESRSGHLSIQHKIETGRVPVVGLRQAIMRGVTPVSVTLKEPLRIHVLEDDHRGTWMTDMPEELNQIGEVLATVQPRGSVLVGGLGLGILARVVAEHPGVERVVVVERDKDVINLCFKPGRDPFICVHADLYQWLREYPGQFDCYLLDTWQGTGEIAWWREVLPLRRIIRNKFGTRPKMWCWAEDIMLGQVKGALMRPHPHHWMHHKLGPLTSAQADRFLWDVGLPQWEKKFAPLLSKEET